MIARKQDEGYAARAKDETELKKAEDALKKAELEVQKNEVISSIDAEKNLEALEQAKANLKQLQETFGLKRSAAKADLRIVEIQRDRAREAMLHAQHNERSEEHTSELQSPCNLVCRLLLEKKNIYTVNDLCDKR